MCDTGAGMYPRSRNVYGVARWWRIGTARNPRVLTTAPLAPDVVPEVKPTIIGAPGSIAVSTCGVARWASSHDTQPAASPRTTTPELQVDARRLAAAASSMSTWSCPRNSGGPITHTGCTTRMISASSCSR